MRPLLFLILVAATCVLSTAMDLRILDGKDAQPGQFPYQAYLSILIRGIKYRCGGSILNENWILTAAHCVHSADSVDIYVGSIWRNSGYVYSAKYIIAHKNYDPNLEKPINDIALLKTDKKIVMKPGFIEPINYSTDYMQGGEIATVSGWGVIYPIYENHLIDETLIPLQYLKVKTISNSQCEIKNEMEKAMYLCTDEKWNKGVDHGDSGGPLVHNNKIIGIVSFKTYLYVYTRVSSYVPWIESKINKFRHI